MKKMKKIAFLPVIILAGIFFSQVAFAATSSGWNIDSLSSFNLPSASIYDILVNLLNWILGILGIVGIIGFAISGIMYLMAAGNETMTGNAKKAMTASILGVIVGLSGLVVIYAVEMALNGAAF